MSVQVSYPGVYIEEFAPAGPIEGVGTGTAAFVGVAAQGELDTPTKITSWESFKETFGSYPVPGFYLWYAVRGFFENGGQVCYVVRASNGTQGDADMTNTAGNKMATLVARRPGNPAIDVEVASNPYLSADLAVYQPTATLASAPSGKELSFTDADEAGHFRPGDTITSSGKSDQVTVVRVSGAAVRVAEDLKDSYTGGEVFQLADLAAGSQTVRLEYAPSGTNTAIPQGYLVQGSVLSFDYETDETHVVESVQTEYMSDGTVTYRVTLRSGLGSLLGLATGSGVVSNEFDIKVNLNSSPSSVTTYARLSFDSAHADYFVDAVNDDASSLVTIELEEPPPADALPDSLPAAATYAIGPGDVENLSTLASSDFVDAITELESIDDVNLLAVPDCLVLRGGGSDVDLAEVATVQQEMIGHCERMFDRFAILDPRGGLELFSTGGDDSIEEQRQGLDSTRGYSALYYPWLRVSPSGSGDPILVPPSGHVCGIIARSDSKRGVHKAPANEIVSGALGVERTMSDVDNGLLNLQGINVIRVFGGGGRPVVWGARTTATDTNWQYVNIRRLFLYIEESIQEGIAWAVFEPNNLQLWQKLKRTIGEFLNRVWRDGGLFGATAEEAYYVRIDEALNPFSEQALGRLHIEIGLRPSYPAEFIIVRIGIWPGGSEVSES